LERLAGRPGDRGAVGVTVALLLGSGVLLGFMALVVDVGQIYVERTQLQSSADAAALAVAKACANQTDDCRNDSTIRRLAQRFVDDNSSDGVSHIQEICGRLEAVVVACSAEASNLTACLGTPPRTGPYVEVRVSTELPGDRFVLPPTFAQAMAGNEDFDGASVGACARAAWQVSFEPVDILALSISVCEFNRATRDGTEYGDVEHPVQSDEYVIHFWDGAFGGFCNPGNGRWGNAGRPAFLDGGGSDCLRRMPANGVIAGEYSPRVALSVLPQSCESQLADAIDNQRVIYLAVHDGVDDSGRETDFHHIYIVPFLPTGYEWGPPPPFEPSQHYKNSVLRDPPTRPCDDEFERCLSGVFLDGPIPLNGVVDNRIVRLIG
jgi:Flp pilus assembly protein TadG